MANDTNNRNSMWNGVNEGVGNGKPPMTKIEDDFNERIANGTGRDGNQMKSSGSKSVLGDNELEAQRDTQPAPGAFGKELRDGEAREGITKPGNVEGM